MGSVLMCGSNSIKGSKMEGAIYPQLVKDNNLVGKRIVDVCASGIRNHVLTDLGSIYWWEVTEVVPKPKLFDALVGVKILKVGAGYSHNLAISENNNSIFMWSCDPQKLNLKSFKIESEAFLNNIAVGEDFFIVSCESGELHSYGSNKFGATGISLHEGTLEKPTRILFTREISEKFVSSSSPSPSSSSNPPSHPNNNLSEKAVSQNKEDLELFEKKLFSSSQNYQVLKNNHQKDLENFLSTNFSKYRAFRILQLALHFQNWQAVSVIYKQLKKWKLYVFSKLKHFSAQSQFFKNSLNTPLQSTTPLVSSDSLLQISSNQDSQSSQFEKQIKRFLEIESLSLLSEIQRFEIKKSQKIKLVLLLLSFWKKFDLSVQVFEEYLKVYMHSLSPLFCSIIKRKDSLSKKDLFFDGEKMEVKENPLLLSFSPSLYISILKNGIEIKKRETERNKINVPSERLWEGIKTNLAKEISGKNNNKISISSLPFLYSNKSSSNPPKRNQTESPKKSIVFTCEHHFEMDNFNQILNELKKKIENHLIPISLQILFSEYKQSNQINLSCPICLFNNYLRKHLPNMNPNSFWNY